MASAAAPWPRPEGLLSIRNLSVRFDTRRGPINAVRGVDLEMARGEICGLVGESGSGKSATSLALTGLHGPDTQVGGSILFEGQSLHTLDERGWAGIRGRRIATIFQDPTACLNPTKTIGRHL